MAKKSDFLQKYPKIKPGMTAYSTDGERLGKVISLDEDHLTVEKGFFFPRDFTFRYDDIVNVKEDNLIINQNREDLGEWRDEKYAGWDQIDTANREEEARIPLREEELVAQKKARPKGETRVRKVVHTEFRKMKVPVTEEEVIVERVSPGKAESETAGGKAFEEEEVTVPVMEEEVEVTKRPVLKEEVRVRKESKTKEKEVSGEVREEEAEVEHTGKS